MILITEKCSQVYVVIKSEKNEHVNFFEGKEFR